MRKPRGPLDDPVESGNSLNRIYWSVSRVLRGPWLTPVPFSRSSSFILLRVGIERRCIARRATSTGSRLTCIYTYLRTRTYTCFSFGSCSLEETAPYSSCIYVSQSICAKINRYRLSENWTPLLHCTGAHENNNIREDALILV